jgi:hypothetical protein
MMHRRRRKRPLQLLGSPQPGFQLVLQGHQLVDLGDDAVLFRLASANDLTRQK